MEPTFTTFDRNQQATNLITVADFRRLANALMAETWREAAEQYAGMKGGCFIVRSNGDLEVYTMVKRGTAGGKKPKFRTSVYPAGKWGWN